MRVFHVRPSVLGVWQDFATLAPNGALPPAKVSAALKVVHQHKAANYTGFPLDAWAEEWGGVLRMTMSQYIKLLREPQRSRTMAKAKPSQKLRIPRACAGSYFFGASLGVRVYTI